MKKTISILLLILVIVMGKINAQVFLSANLESNGAGLSVGLESNNVAFTVGMQHPVFSAEKPTIFSMQAGYVYHFTEQNSFVIGGHFGAAYLKKKVIKDNLVASEPKEFKPMETLEVGKNMYSGRLSLTLNYCNDFFYGVSMKVFF